MEVLNDNSFVDFNEEDIEIPFSGNIEASFLNVQKVLEENNQGKLKLEVLKSISSILNYLAEYGNVHENLVFETAQLYVLIKHSKLDLIKAEKYFAKFALEACADLIKKEKDIDEYITNIFENKKFTFISKIKIAELIYELENQKIKAENEFYKEAVCVLSKYAQNSQKDLIEKLSFIIK